MEKIYIDESGNTGQDLLNSDQKVFVLASNNFSDSELEFFSTLFDKKNEIHFKKLKNSGSGRRSIINFLNHERITEKNIICSTAHKEYCTVGQVVDQLMEPVLFDKGFDIYKQGQIRSLISFIFHFDIFFWDKTLFKKRLFTFVEMIRKKTEKEIKDFYETANDLHKTLKPEEQQMLSPLIESKT
jgi:hypothetical protein